MNELYVRIGLDDVSGQFYVMMSPHDALGGQRSIAPRTHSFSSKLDGSRPTRDDRKRATHNEGSSRINIHFLSPFPIYDESVLQNNSSKAGSRSTRDFQKGRAK